MTRKPPDELAHFIAKPVTVRALQMPEGHYRQSNFKQELEDNGVATYLYDKDVTYPQVPCPDGSTWMWSQASIQVQHRFFTIYPSDWVVLDGWHVYALPHDVFAYRYRKDKTQ